MSTPEPDLVLRSDDPCTRQLEAQGWHQVATSWGARLEFDAANAPRLRRLMTEVDAAGYTLRELVPGDVAQLLMLDRLTAPDYPGGVATRHEALDEPGARALLERGRAWGIWSGTELVALTTTTAVEDRVETEFTTVHPAHRRRGLATAVKAASVLAHAADGATRFGTGGADSNVASLAMNRAVGYRITETWHTYRRPSARPTHDGAARPAREEDRSRPGGMRHDDSDATRLQS